MDKGKVIAGGTIDELKSNIRCTETIVVETKGIPEDIVQGAGNIEHVFEVQYDKNVLTVRCSGGKHNVVRLLGYLQDNNVHIGRVQSERPTLNTIFLELTGKELRDN